MSILSKFRGCQGCQRRREALRDLLGSKRKPQQGLLDNDKAKPGEEATGEESPKKTE